MHQLCLVIEPVRLVAEDLAELIRENIPHMNVLVVDSVSDVRLTEDVVASIGMAFVHAAPRDFRTSALGQRLSAAGIPLVFTAVDFAWTDFVSLRVMDEPIAARSELILPSPFSGIELAAVLAAVRLQCPSCGSGAS